MIAVCDKRIDEILDLLKPVEIRLEEIEKEINQLDYKIERLDNSYFKRLIPNFQEKISEKIYKQELLKSEIYNLEIQKKKFKELLSIFS